MTNNIVDPVSDTFAVVEYLLQMQLDAPCFRISEMRDINCKQAAHNFNKYVKTMENANVVDVFLPIREVQQPISDITLHGIRIPTSGYIKITTDHLTLPEGQDEYQVLHLIVALGTIINYQDYESDLGETKYISGSFPPEKELCGHNSIRINDNDTYLIYNASQIKCLHLITFKGGENLSHKEYVINVCGICGKPNATLWCESDHIKLCPECDKETHNANPLFQQHERVPLREALARTQYCPIHPNQRCPYYCKKCHQALC